MHYWDTRDTVPYHIPTHNHTTISSHALLGHSGHCSISHTYTQSHNNILSCTIYWDTRDTVPYHIPTHNHTTISSHALLGHSGHCSISHTYTQSHNNILSCTTGTVHCMQPVPYHIHVHVCTPYFHTPNNYIAKMQFIIHTGRCNSANSLNFVSSKYHNYQITMQHQEKNSITTYYDKASLKNILVAGFPAVWVLKPPYGRMEIFFF